MPSLKGRRKFERSIKDRLASLFADLLGGISPIDMLGSRFQTILADELTHVYAKAFQNLGSSDLTNNPTLAEALGRQYATERAAKVATSFLRNIGEEATKGVDPATILSASRAENIGTTEVTAAVTVAETSARESDRSGIPRIVGADVAVDDGMIAIWVTIGGPGGDERTCKICEALDLEPETEWRDQYPFGPPAHPNCRCHLEYVPEGIDLTSWLANRK